MLKNTSTIQTLTTDPMNTTIRYCFPDSLKFRYMSFDTYEKALRAIELFKQIEVKAELKVS